MMSEPFPTFRAVARRIGLSSVPRIAAAVLLVWATSFYHCRDFYELLRWLVFGTAALTAVIAFSNRKPAWTWLAAMIAVLFNPFHEVRLSQDTWHVLDVVAAGFFLVSILFVAQNGRSSGRSE